MAWPDVIPYIRYEDARAMLDWLEEAFGFERRVVFEEDDKVVHGEITFGSGMVMVASTHEGMPDAAKTPKQLGGQATGGMYVIVEDPDTHCERARGAGAEIVREPQDQHYGSRDYVARDPEGHSWSFGTYRPE